MFLVVFTGTGDYVSKPVIESTRSGIYSSMRTVDTNTLLGQPQERTLLRVSQGKSLQGSEDDGICGSLADRTTNFIKAGKKNPYDM